MLPWQRQPKAAVTSSGSSLNMFNYVLISAASSSKNNVLSKHVLRWPHRCVKLDHVFLLPKNVLRCLNQRHGLSELQSLLPPAAQTRERASGQRQSRQSVTVSCCQSVIVSVIVSAHGTHASSGVAVDLSEVPHFRNNVVTKKVCSIPLSWREKKHSRSPAPRRAWVGCIQRVFRAPTSVAAIACRSMRSTPTASRKSTQGNK